MLSVCSESDLHGTGLLLCLFLLTFSLAKDGKFQRPELVMAGCPFWKSNGLDAKGMSWSYTSGKVVPSNVLALDLVPTKRSGGSILWNCGIGMKSLRNDIITSTEPSVCHFVLFCLV